jgi:3-oxoadipate enol-lactonase
VNHRLDGEGDRVVVLAGGLGTTLELWDAQMPALAPRFRVLRYDHPGHGGSPLLDDRSVAGLARAVVALLDDLELAQVSFCGLSLGGAVGMQLALDAPDRVDRLALCATSARFGTPESWDVRVDAVRRGGVAAVADIVLERWFTPAFRDVRRYREMLVSTSAEGYIQCCEALREWDLRGALDGIGAPTLAVAGSDDPSTPPADLEAIVAGIPDAQLVVIERVRHLLNVERADEFNEAVLAHL